jgi:hypothetical protein
MQDGACYNPVRHRSYLDCVCPTDVPTAVAPPRPLSSSRHTPHCQLLRRLDEEPQRGREPSTAPSDEASKRSRSTGSLDDLALSKSMRSALARWSSAPVDGANGRGRSHEHEARAASGPSTRLYERRSKQKSAALRPRSVWHPVAADGKMGLPAPVRCCKPIEPLEIRRAKAQPAVEAIGGGVGERLVWLPRRLERRAS